MNTNWLKNSIIFSIFLGLSVFYYTNFIYAENTLINKLKGKILLQVEDNGEAWYVNPYTEERYFLGRPKDAFDIMKKLGVGVTEEDIWKIPMSEEVLTGKDTDGDGLPDTMEDALGTNRDKEDTDGDGYSDKNEILSGYNPKNNNKLYINTEFAQKQAGKILIQAEKNGEAWYVNPDNNKRYFLGRPKDAFEVMRNLGLGITNKNLAKIPEYITNTEAQNDYLVQNNSTNTTNGNRKYSDSRLGFTFEYPKDWKITKESKHNTIFIGDYKEKLFEEKKGLIIIDRIRTEDETNISQFKIASKEKATKNINEDTEVNEMKAFKEGFAYDHLGSFEITTYIEINPQEFIRISLVSAGDKGKYTQIYNDTVRSIELAE